MSETITDYLGIFDGSAAAVIGCGGKTSFIRLAANKFRDKKVLISPTTKMLPMKDEGIILCETLRQCMEHRPKAGIRCMGLLDENGKKLKALPGHILAAKIPEYDITLLEADGSRGLPCKGWLETEPVVPGFCTHTIGIVTLTALGKPATGTFVHRLPEFLSLTGLKEGEVITLEALEAMLCASKGMFKNSVGLRCILVNKVEDDADARAASGFLQNIKRKYPERFAKLIYGSVHFDIWKRV